MPGNLSSLKNACAHASMGEIREEGVYSNSRLTRSNASGGVRGLNTCMAINRKPHQTLKYRRWQLHISVHATQERFTLEFVEMVQGRQILMFYITSLDQSHADCTICIDKELQHRAC